MKTKKINKFSNYIRTCKRCNEIFRTTTKGKKICPNCDLSVNNGTYKRTNTHTEYFKLLEIYHYQKEIKAEE